MPRRRWYSHPVCSEMIVRCATGSYALPQNRSMFVAAGVGSTDAVSKSLFVDFLIVGDRSQFERSQRIS